MLSPRSMLRSFTTLLTLGTLVGCPSDDVPGILTDTDTTSGSSSSSSTTALPTTTVDPTTAGPTSSSTTDAPTTGEVTITTSTTDPSTTSTTDPSTTSTTDPGTSSSTTGDPLCPPGDPNPVCMLPPEEKEPTPKPDGVPSPLPGVYDDLGEAPLDNEVRALIGFPTRQRVTLEQRVADIYTPGHPDFRKYLTVDEWMTDHAPTQADYDLIKAWLDLVNLQVTFESSNRMIIAFYGTVADFNSAFNTTLHICLRKNPQQGNPPFEVYCTVDSFTVPKFVADRTNGLLTADMPADKGTLPGEAGTVISDPPGPGAYDPKRIATAYNVNPLYQAGNTGQGSKLGVVAAATYHSKDLQTFWKSFGITRALPKRFQMMEPVVTRITETILDVQWSSSMAPGAEVNVYEGPDARNTALLFTFNEAIARNEVDVLTTSFAHREDSEPKPLRHQYDESALQGAAYGITVLSASGDSARPDTPCSSPYVTCVGGTELFTDMNGNVSSETAWTFSGSGDTKTFDVPPWQQGLPIASTRALCDVALNASPSSSYWVRRFGVWQQYGGTSFASPVFAGIVAVMNSQRIAQGKPRLGWLNSIIYTVPAAKATFRDIIQGGTDLFNAGPGWDYPTGLGAPQAKKLVDAIP